jgi:uncharacterized protein (DUF58 family)
MRVSLQPTLRALILVIAVALLVGLSTLWDGLGIAAALLGGLSAALLLADWRLSARPDDWLLHRQHDNRLSLAADNSIHIQVQHRRTAEQIRRPIQIWVRDTPPPLFYLHPDDRILTATLAPGSRTELSYRVRPPRRGDYIFGDLYIRWQSYLGLFRRQTRIPAAGPVKVYPNLADVHKYDLLDKRNQLWELGLRNARRFGSGAEFERLREYQPDDEYRRIHWKATARRHTPIVMEYETERSQNILALLDIGRMMRSPVGDIAKLDYAINAVLLLAYVALRKGDRVGLLTFADAPQTWVPPRGGKAQFQRMLEQLYTVESQPIEPNYTDAFAYLAAKQSKRSLILVFSDLTGDIGAQSLFAHMAHLQKRHLTLLITLRDPTIQALARQTIGSTHDVYRRTVAEQLLDERRLLLERLQRQGVLTLDAPASELSAHVINRYLELKARTLL